MNPSCPQRGWSRACARLRARLSRSESAPRGVWAYNFAAPRRAVRIFRLGDASGLPDSPQNFWLGGLSEPHAVQRLVRRAPHSPQNFAAAAFSWAQAGQIIVIGRGARRHCGAKRQNNPEFTAQARRTLFKSEHAEAGPCTAYGTRLTNLGERAPGSPLAQITSLVLSSVSPYRRKVAGSVPAYSFANPGAILAFSRSKRLLPARSLSTRNGPKF